MNNPGKLVRCRWGFRRDKFGGAFLTALMEGQFYTTSEPQ